MLRINFYLDYHNFAFDSTHDKEARVNGSFIYFDKSHVENAYISEDGNFQTYFQVLDFQYSSFCLSPPFLF